MHEAKAQRLLSAMVFAEGGSPDLSWTSAWMTWCRAADAEDSACMLACWLAGCQSSALEDRTQDVGGERAVGSGA